MLWGWPISSHPEGKQSSELFDTFRARESSFRRNSYDVLRLIQEKEILGFFEFLKAAPFYFHVLHIAVRDQPFTAEDHFALSV